MKKESSSEDSDSSDDAPVAKKPVVKSKASSKAASKKSSRVASRKQSKVKDSSSDSSDSDSSDAKPKKGKKVAKKAESDSDESEEKNGEDVDMENGGELEDRDKRELFVGGVSFETTEDSLWAHFEQYGELIKCSIPQKNGRSSGIAFVEFTKAKDANKALAEDGNEFEGRKLNIRFSSDKKPPAARDG